MHKFRGSSTHPIHKSSWASSSSLKLPKLVSFKECTLQLLQLDIGCLTGDWELFLPLLKLVLFFVFLHYYYADMLSILKQPCLHLASIETFLRGTTQKLHGRRSLGIVVHSLTGGPSRIPICNLEKVESSLNFKIETYKLNKLIPFILLSSKNHWRELGDRLNGLTLSEKILYSPLRFIVLRYWSRKVLSETLSGSCGNSWWKWNNSFVALLWAPVLVRWHYQQLSTPTIWLW